MSEPLILELNSGDPEEVDRAFGGATDAILVEQRALVLNLGAAVYQKQAAGSAMVDWLERSATLLRTRCLGVAFVVPDWWEQWQLKLLLFARPVPTRSKVFRSLEQANAWARQQTR